MQRQLQLAHAIKQWLDLEGRRRRLDLRHGGAFDLCEEDRDFLSESLHGFHKRLHGRPEVVVREQFRNRILARQLPGHGDRLLRHASTSRIRQERGIVVPNHVPVHRKRSIS